MDISLHPKAKEAFNQTAEELLAAVTALWEASAPMTGPPLLINDVPVPIEVLWESFQDSNIRSAVAFVAEGKVVRLEGEGFLPMVRFAERVQARSELAEVVSVEAVLELLVTWYRARIAGSDPGSFADMLLKWLEENVVERTIVFPIFEFELAGTLRVRGVEIRELQSSEIKKWYKGRPEGVTDPEWEAVEQQELENWQKRIGGRAAAFVSVTAEPVRAKELAFNQADEVISIVRSFAPALLIPQRRSYCAIYGFAHVEKVTSFTVDPFGWVQVSQEQLAGSAWWHLDEETLRAMAKIGFVNTIALLDRKEPTAFEDAVVRSLILYSRGALEPRVESKLLYIVAAIESLLLVDETEPVVASVSRRFAYFVGENLEERKEIRRRFQAAYKARSGFVHHGRTIDDYLLIEGFMEDAWWFFRKIVFHAEKHQDKAQYVGSLEDEMLAGPRAEMPSEPDLKQPIS